MGRHSRKRNAPPQTLPQPPAQTPPQALREVRQPGAGAEAGAARPAPRPAPQQPPPPVPPAGAGPYRQESRPPAVPRPYPGSPAPGGPATPAHGSPSPGRVAPPGAAPVRGGHPEHREPGGGWGDDGNDGTRAASGRGALPGARTPAPGTRRRDPSGPRQDYLDAFEDDVFAAGAPTGTPLPGVPRTRAPGDRAAGPPRAGGPPGRQDLPGPDEPAGPFPDTDDGAEGRPLRARTKGRTFTGVAAAAVTTVLAVVVAGQVTGLEQRRENRAAAAGTGAAQGEDVSARSGPSTSPSASEAPRPATYEEKMGRVRPFDPDLHGPGDFVAVGGHQEGTGEGQVVRYRVETEKDLPLDGAFFAEAVHRTLNDDRSWAHDGARSFERVADGKEADFVITLASPGTTGEWCARSGLDTTVRNVSCDSASTERIMINAWRWAQGSETFGEARIREYREMLINHEVGHRLGFGHRYCDSGGTLAPVMMQQTKTLTTEGRTCRPNAWPHPERTD